MDGSSLSNRDRRRKAAASRRAARDPESDGGLPYRDAGAYQTPDGRQRQRPRVNQRHQPLETTLLSSLSQALTNIDAYNNEGQRGDGYDSETITFPSPGAQGIHSDRKTRYVQSKLPPPPSQFSSYLKFNRPTLNCLLIFTTCYILVLICCYPMISYANVDDLQNDDAIGAKHHIKRGASFQHVRGRKQFLKAKHALGTLKERAIEWEEQAKMQAKRGAVEIHEAEKDIIDSIAGGTVGRRDGEDAQRAGQLLERAVADFDAKRVEQEKEEHKKGQDAAAGGHDLWKDAVQAWDSEFAQDRYGRNVAEAIDASHKGKTPGAVVLGMHRSGTSMLSGLLVKGFGYETGGPLIGASFDNEKGFYERIDIVLQNDEFMEAQNAGWSWNVINYDSDKALRHKEQGKVTFKEGAKGLKFLNNHQRRLPYLQKDPRMCITLPTWLKLMDEKPAVVFTYRHPLEVALSLKHRESGFTIEHGLRLWIVYNMLALQNSEDLCRVFSTNEAVFKDPMEELQRIKNELTEKCHVVPPPTHELSSEVVDKFVDPKLQHNSKERKAEEKKRGVLKDFGKGCVARRFESEYGEGTANRKAEEEMYLMSMQVFCDLENGKAYANDYEWPDLLHWQRPASIH